MTTPAITVTVLGSSGSYAGPGDACTGFLVQSLGARVWLDAGPGTLAAIQEHVALRDLTAVVVSHEHPDHWLELPVLCNALRYYVERPPLPVFGTEGTKRLLQHLSPSHSSVFEWHTVSDGHRSRIGDQDWRWANTDHYVETLACRVRVGSSSMVFSADTGTGWEIGRLGSEFDLAVVESTYLAVQESEGLLHLSARQAGLAAASVGARHLVLTHLAPGEDPEAHRVEAAGSFDGPIDVARKGNRFEA